MAYFIKRHLGVWAVLFSCVLLAAFLSADSAGKNNANSARGFLYSEYLSGGGRVAAVAGGGFTVENRGGFWARGGEIFSAATARATDFPVGHWILDYAMEDADILRR
ncbi:MAG: hypothetical protein HAW59_05025, partial [Betaproteobacteria bacterium]|nr:hypothetical protein [Betaproteobacteria bacterium]